MLLLRVPPGHVQPVGCQERGGLRKARPVGQYMLVQGSALRSAWVGLDRTIEEIIELRKVLK